MSSAIPNFAVKISEDAEAVHTGWFETLEEAEAFAEEWTERVPSAHADFISRVDDPELWEVVEVDTALPEDHLRSSPND